MKIWLKAVAVVFGVGCMLAAAEGAEASGDGKLKALIVEARHRS